MEFESRRRFRLAVDTGQHGTSPGRSDGRVCWRCGAIHPGNPVTAISLSAQPRDGSGVGRDAAAWEREVKEAVREGTGEIVLGEEAAEGEAKDEEAEELKKIKGEDLG